MHACILRLYKLASSVPLFSHVVNDQGRVINHQSRDTGSFQRIPTAAWYSSVPGVKQSKNLKHPPVCYMSRYLHAPNVVCILYTNYNSLCME